MRGRGCTGDRREREQRPRSGVRARPPLLVTEAQLAGDFGHRSQIQEYGDGEEDEGKLVNVLPRGLRLGKGDQRSELYRWQQRAQELIRGKTSSEAG
jgi:hypothetical protein